MFVENGGADGPFRHYEASPEAIEFSAEDLDARASGLQAFSKELDEQHKVAMTQVSGVLADPMSTATQTPLLTGSQIMGYTYVSAGSVRLFGQGVQRFNKTIDSLNEQFRQGQASDFGVAPADTPDDASLTEQASAVIARAEAIMEGRAAMLGDLRQQYQKALEELDVEGASAAAKIHDGPSDQVIKDLFAAGVLPTSVALAYPNMQLATTKLPPDIAKLSPEEVEDYLRDHPEAATVVNGLLTKDGLSDLEQAVVEAQGRIDAELLKEGMSNPAASEGLQQITDAQARLQLINDHVAQTGVLNDAAHSYTVAWMNEVGADNLAKLPSVVETKLSETMTREPVGFEGMVDSYLTPVGNAILNLSNEQLQDTVLPEGQGTTYRYDFNSDGVIDKNDMPQAIRELMSIRIGENDGQKRYGEIDEDLNASFDSIQNLDRFNGWADLIGSSTVEGGEEYSVDLAEQAIQAKQDMNAILVSANRDADMGGMTQQELAELRTTMDDAGTSDLLSVVSRNQDASSALLIDDVHREELLGMNWNDSDGAADIIRAGTDRTTGDGGGGQEQAEAALEVLKEVGEDGVQYEARMSEGVSDAVVDAGITWMDTFTRPEGAADALGVDLDAQDALGRDLQYALNLTDEEQAKFLQFVAGTDDDDALRFRTAANAYAQSLIADALTSGHGPTVNQAMTAAGRLDGAITAADYEWAIDQDEYDYDEKRAAQMADTRRSQGLATFLKMGVSVAATTGGAVFPPAAPFLSVGSTVLGPIIDGVLTGDSEVPVQDIADNRGELLAGDHANSIFWQNYMLLSAADQAQVPIPDDTGDYEPEAIYETDSQGDIVTDEKGRRILKDFDELDPDELGNLGGVQSSVFDEWRRHNPGETVEDGKFNEGRGSKVTDSRWDNDEQPADGWNNDRTAEERLYGDNVPEGYDGDDGLDEGTPREHYPDESYQIDPTKKRR